jgi:tRNA nucleotidyltransferase/poly(A) polymerase
MTDLIVAHAEWFLKPETQAVFACLNREGFEARVVGGAVRNTFLNEPVREVDFATTARPEDTLRLAAQAGIKTVPTGISHGTVTLIVHGIPFEVTTLRQDVETHGRRATVAFGEDWAEDARRRDFTMNALYAGSKGDVYDPLQGAADLLARRVRFVGDAGARIQEDYLRILRFFRFSAQYARGAFDREGVGASIRERFGLRRLSRERIRSELLHILVARRAVDAIEVMDESGLLILIFGGVARRERFNRLCQIEAALGLWPDPIFRLAALGVFIQEDAARLSAKLRLSSQDTNTLLSLASAPSVIQPRTRELKAALYQLGPRIYLGCVLLTWASAGASVNNAAWVSAVDLLRSWPRPKFPIGGADLIARGWTSGAALGDRLRRLEEEWIASGFLLSREDLLQLPDDSR